VKEIGFKPGVKERGSSGELLPDGMEYGLDNHNVSVPFVRIFERRLPNKWKDKCTDGFRFAHFDMFNQLQRLIRYKLNIYVILALYMSIHIYSIFHYDMSCNVYRHANTLIDAQFYQQTANGL